MSDNILRSVGTDSVEKLQKKRAHAIKNALGVILMRTQLLARHTKENRVNFESLTEISSVIESEVHKIRLLVDG